MVGVAQADRDLPSRAWHGRAAILPASPSLNSALPENGWSCSSRSRLTVASMARPGGNTTGFSFIEFGTAGKWLELLKQIATYRREHGTAGRQYYRLLLH